VRTLLNFEDGKVKLIQIVIAAQLEIRQKLADPSNGSGEQTRAGSVDGIKDAH
jgi:hypothetical protein